MKNLKKVLILALFIIAFFTIVIIKPALMFILFGLYIGISFIKAIFFLTKINKEGIDCTGKIIDYEKDSEGSSTPVIEFTTIDGLHVKDKPYIYSSTSLVGLEIFSSKKKVDKPVRLLYFRDSPKKFIIIKQNGDNYFAIALFLIISLTLLTLGFLDILGYIHIK